MFEKLSRKDKILSNYEFLIDIIGVTKYSYIFHLNHIFFIRLASHITNIIRIELQQLINNIQHVYHVEKLGTFY